MNKGRTNWIINQLMRLNCEFIKVNGKLKMVWFANKNVNGSKQQWFECANKIQISEDNSENSQVIN